MSAVRKVDQNALRVNQAFIIILLLLAFLASVEALVAFVAVVMLVGAFFPDYRLFVLIYRHVLLPTEIIKPEVVEDNPEPHRFSMLLGGLFLAAATLCLFALDALSLGWALSFVVVVLAAVNLFLGFCVGCFVYYQLNRLGVPGFNRAPI
jgi:Domain of unknown function (DUF4395)